MDNSECKIIFITNIKRAPHEGYKKYLSPLDYNKRLTNFRMYKILKRLDSNMVWYKEKERFIENINKHKEDLVFPYHHGIGSKIRQSYIQTFCESYDIQYIGPDAYALTVGNDKALSKEICRHFEIETPHCKLFFDKDYPPDIYQLKLPLIVKPQFEADSIGISDKNVFFTYKDVIPFASKLLDNLKQPVIIEEFIEGKEYSVCLIGYKRTIKKMEFIEYIGKDSLVYSYNKKKFTIRKYANITNKLTTELSEKIISLFHAMDKMEFMRLDFIVRDGIFYNIELTPDPSLSPLSCFYLSFKGSLTYPQFLNLIITNCKERYQNELSLLNKKICNY